MKRTNDPVLLAILDAALVLQAGCAQQFDNLTEAQLKLLRATVASNNTYGKYDAEDCQYDVYIKSWAMGSTRSISIRKAVKIWGDE